MSLRLAWTLETHVHADHVSRARILAEETGAKLLIPEQQRVKFDFTPVADGDRIEIGSAHLTALHTPGHTLESTCYLLDDACVFTGDTVFLNSIGRPDLDADEQETRERARLLFHSLYRLQSLPPHLLTLAAHASKPVPFDSIPLTEALGDVFSRLSEWFLSEGKFITRVLARLPPPPPNYGEIVKLNESCLPAEMDVTELEAGANRCAAG